jgi:FkbM family methyltransferase
MADSPQNGRMDRVPEELRLIKTMLRALRAEHDLRRTARAIGASIAVYRRAIASTDDRVTVETRFGPLYWRPNETDLRVILGILVNGEYELAGMPQMAKINACYEAILSRGKTPVIVDAGANIGAASIWFSRLFQRAQIVAVEPDPKNADLARLNTAAYPNVRVFESAIGAVSGWVVVEAHEGGAWASRTSRSDAGVQVITVPELLETVPDGALFIVKVDIEGFESDLFAENPAWVADAAAIIIEPHDWMLPGRGTSQSFQRALIGSGREILVLGENLVFI